MMSMFPKDTKVLILYNKIFDYRIPIWNILAEQCDLTVAYCEGKDKSGCNFKRIALKEPYRLGPFSFHKENIYKLAKQYDVVIALGNIKWPKYTSLAFRKRKFKFATWSIGVSASYTKGYDAITRWDWIRDIFYKAADACIFYTDYAVKKNLQRGFDPKRMFVANNTVEVLPLNPNIAKDSLLFIGTLYRQKGLQLLLDAYSNVNKMHPDLPQLVIIGGGDEFEAIKEWIEFNNLEDKIHLLGPIYDKELKRSYFQKAIACISPNQAGLAVLESMGYGVPFITKQNAITGGEIFNITNGKTGILLNSDNELETVLHQIAEHPYRFEEMGKNARAYYTAHRTPEIMAQGILDAISSMLENNYVSKT